MTLVEGVIERRLEHGEHTIGGGAAGADRLVADRRRLVPRLTVLGAALRWCRGHSGRHLRSCSAVNSATTRSPRLGRICTVLRLMVSSTGCPLCYLNST
jgi:hypothetical protein